MQFLHPIWLSAFAGILVPIAIHLWNTRQGRVLEVGTIRFMEPSQKKRASNLRISEWLLLVIRCLCILLFAIVMAGPIWNTSKSAEEKGWLLVPKNELKVAYRQKNRLIDSLLKNGFRLHAFEFGFPAISFKDSLKYPPDTAIEEVNNWSLISNLAQTAAPQLELNLISTGPLANFKGSRPNLKRKISWALIERSNEETQICNAWLASEDSIGVLMSNSSSKSTTFINRFLGLRNHQEKNFSVNVSKGKISLRYKNQPEVFVDTNLFRIALYADQYQHDAGYVKASIQAIKEYNRRKIQLEVYSSKEAIPLKADLLFWLSDAEIPAQFTGKIISYQKGALIQENGLIYGIPQQSENQIELYKYYKTDQKNLEAIWENGKGDPILAIAPLMSNHYLIFTHLNPSWNNLVWSNRFPEWLLQFVLGGLYNHSLKDIRSIDSNEIQFSNEENVSKPIIYSKSDAKPITNIFWLILMLVFVLERILTFTSKYRSHD